MKFRDKASKYCVKCGAGVHINDRECPWCGKRIKEVNRPNTMFAFWGFLLPPIGWVLYFTHHYRMPRKANSAAKGALLSSILLLSAVILVLAFSLVSGSVQ